MKIIDTKKDLSAFNQKLDDVYSQVNNLVSNGWFDLLELAYPGKVGLPDDDFCADLMRVRDTLNSLSYACSSLSDDITLIINKD